MTRRRFLINLYSFPEDQLSYATPSHHPTRKPLETAYGQEAIAN